MAEISYKLLLVLIICSFIALFWPVTKIPEQNYTYTYKNLESSNVCHIGGFLGNGCFVIEKR